jgi:hypothetical protein
MDTPNRFHLEIDGLEEFVAFCAIIRGQTLDDELRAIVAKLVASTADLADAQQTAGAPPPPSASLTQ